jgi:hypothetical protein
MLQAWPTTALPKYFTIRGDHFATAVPYWLMLNAYHPAKKSIEVGAKDLTIYCRCKALL